MTDLQSCITTRDALRKTQEKIGHLLDKYDKGELLPYEVVEKLRKVYQDLIVLHRKPLD